MPTLKVLSAGACEGPLRELAPAFTAKTGHQLDIAIDTVGSLKNRLMGGEKADVALLSEPAIDALEQAGVLAAGSKALLGHARTGLAVREGGLAPDISTVEAFKKVLTHAQSIAVTDPAHGGSSGIYLAGLFQRLDVADAIAGKLVLGKNGHDVGTKVATGKAEIGLTFTSEFVPIAGVEVVGPLPDEIGFVNGYGVALPAGEPAPGAAELAAFLTTPEAKARFQAFGLV